MAREQLSMISISEDVVQTGAKWFPYGQDTARIQNGEAFQHKGTRKVANLLTEMATQLHLPMHLIEGDVAIHHSRSGNTYLPVAVGDHAFWIRGRGLMHGGSLAEAIGEKPINIHLVTGMCLFSESAVQAKSATENYWYLTNPGVVIDQQVENIVIDKRLSLYEVESVVRLSSIIGEMIQTNANSVSVMIHIPRIEYYLYALDAFRDHNLTPEQLFGWFDAVDARARVVSEHLTHRIARKSAKSSIRMVPVTPLVGIEAWMRERIHAGVTPHLSRAMEILARSDPLWKAVLGAHYPASWVEVGFLSYMYTYLHAGFSLDSDGLVNLALAIENPTEERIYKMTKETILSRLPKANGAAYNIMALYVHEHVVPRDGKLPYDQMTFADSRRRDIYNICSHYRNGTHGRGGHS